MEVKQAGSGGLQRGMGLLDASTLVIGCVIGAGIFRLSGRVAAECPSAFMFLLAWVLGGMLSLCGALCFAELSALFPKTGGDYVFLTNAYGRPLGFVFGWTKLFVERTGTIAIVAMVFAEHACRVMGWEASWDKILASGAIIFLTAANVLGLRFGKNIQNVFTFLKVLALAFIIGAGLFSGKGNAANFTPFWPAWSWNLLSSTGLALIFVLWTYDGWAQAAYVAEEVRNPEKNIPRAIVGGLLGVTALYLLVNFIYLYYIPLPEMAGTKLVAAAAVDKIWPSLGGTLVAAMVMVSTLGSVNGFVLSGGRILFALGRDHKIFHKLSSVNPRTHTPAAALVVLSTISLALVWTGTLDQLVTYTEIVIFLFFGMSGISLFVFRKRLPDAPRSTKVWGYPFTPIIFIVMCFAFALNAIFHQPKVSLLGVLMALLGLPLYYLSQMLSRRNPA